MPNFTEEPPIERGDTVLMEIEKEERILASLERFNLSEIVKGVDYHKQPIDEKTRARSAMWLIVKEDGLNILDERKLLTTISLDFSKPPVGNLPDEEKDILEKQVKLRNILKIILEEGYPKVTKRERSDALLYFEKKKSTLSESMNKGTQSVEECLTDLDEPKKQQLILCNLATAYIESLQIVNLG